MIIPGTRIQELETRNSKLEIQNSALFRKFASVLNEKAKHLANYQKTFHDWDEIPVVVHHCIGNFYFTIGGFYVQTLSHDADCGYRHH